MNQEIPENASISARDPSLEERFRAQNPLPPGARANPPLRPHGIPEETPQPEQRVPPATAGSALPVREEHLP